MKTLLYNAKVHTQDENEPLAEAVLTEGSRFLAVGDMETLLRLCDAETKRIDLRGAAVYPGLIDSHLHILNWAVTAQELVLNDLKSRKEVIRAIRDRVKENKEQEWIDGRGFNEDLWEDDKRLLTRRELDAIAPDRGVRLTRVCGHMVIANSKAIELAGVTRETAVPDGGEMDWDMGIFSENAIALLFSGERDAGVEKCKEYLYAGLCHAADKGLTGIFSDDLGTDGFSMHTVMQAYRELEKEGRMPVRVVEQCALPDDAAFREFLDAGFAYGQGSDLIRIGPRKLYADGSLGARTAWLSVPYADSPGKRGVPIYRQEELNALAKRTHEAGMPFIVHAIGDAAADSVLEAIAYAREAVPGTDPLPDGIVHCQITTPSILDRIAQMGVHVYAQPVFTEYDWRICRSRVGAEMERTSYQWKTLLHRGVCISSGSDCPVEPLDAAKNIYCAVTRRDFSHEPRGGWMKEQCLTVEEAIFCHTVQAARAVGMQDRLGRIRPGYLTVFPRELESLDEDALLDQKPLLTMTDGRLRLCPDAGIDWNAMK